MKLLNTRRKHAAFTLVEVALAMGIASFCLVVVLGLVPLGIDTSAKASDETVGSSILTHVLADLRATPMTSPPGTEAVSSEYQLKIPAHAATGNASTVLPPIYFGNSAQQFSFSSSAVTARYRLTVTFLPSTGTRSATGVSLLVSWPPQVDPVTGTPVGRVQIFASLDRN